MITYQDAYEKIVNTAKLSLKDCENLNVEDAVGRVLAEDVFAPCSIQPFDNSAMDGYALKSTDLEGAAEGNVIQLTLKAVVAAGELSQEVVEEGTCIKIMTGAPTPQGADAVVPVENAQVQGNVIQFSIPASKGQNVRYAGEDFKEGEKVLSAGEEISFIHILPLASLGISHVLVRKPLKAAFIATGKELVDDLSQPLKGGEIYNSNRPYAEAALKNMGIDCVRSLTIHDKPDLFSKSLQAILESDVDMILSSGAVSAGDFDFVRTELEKLGAEIIFHKVKMKPGKPNLFARFPDGKLYFGIPGNPAATAVGLRFMVEPARRAMLGLPEEKSLRVKVSNAFSKKVGFQMFLKGKVSISNNECHIEVSAGQQSFQVNPFLNMTHWVIAPTEVERLVEGDCVEVFPV